MGGIWVITIAFFAKCALVTGKNIRTSWIPCLHRIGSSWAIVGWSRFWRFLQQRLHGSKNVFSTERFWYISKIIKIECVYHEFAVPYSLEICIGECENNASAQECGCNYPGFAASNVSNWNSQSTDMRFCTLAEWAQCTSTHNKTRLCQEAFGYI